MLKRSPKRIPLHLPSELHSRPLASMTSQSSTISRDMDWWALCPRNAVLVPSWTINGYVWRVIRLTSHRRRKSSDNIIWILNTDVYLRCSIISIRFTTSGLLCETEFRHHWMEYLLFVPVFSLQFPSFYFSQLLCVTLWVYEKFSA